MTPQPNSEGLAGRVALVTGGSRGIGRACCLAVGRAGAKVAVNYRTREADAIETERQLREMGCETLRVAGDVSVEEDVRRMLDRVRETWGPVELLVNNAGVFDYLGHEDLTPEIWRRTLDVNLTGTYLVSWGVKDEMLARGYGRIVNLSSISALQPRPLSIAYAASKAGLSGLTKGCAAAWGPRGVRVNAVAPGLIETEILDVVAEDKQQALVDATPLGRIGTPEDVAELVLYLLSDRSSFVTGQTMVVCGGRAMVP